MSSRTSYTTHFLPVSNSALCNRFPQFLIVVSGPLPLHVLRVQSCLVALQTLDRCAVRLESHRYRVPIPLITLLGQSEQSLVFLLVPILAGDQWVIYLDPLQLAFYWVSVIRLIVKNVHN